MGERTPVYAALGAALLVAGCNGGGSSSDDAGKANLQALHAVSNMSTVEFLREEESWSTLEYGASTSIKSVDAGQYDLNFDALLPDDDADDPTRLETVSANLLKGRSYLVVLWGSYFAREMTVYDKPIHTFDTGDDDDMDVEVQFLHLADSLGKVDVYLEKPGANLSVVQARATLSLSDDSPASIAQAGTYQVIVTAPADPSQVLFVSNDFTLTRHTSATFAVLDAAGQGAYDYEVAAFGASLGQTLLDRNVRTQLRAAHAAPGTGAVDVVVGDNFAAPLANDTPFGGTSPYAEVTSGKINLNVTPGDNPGVFLDEEQLSLGAGTRSTLLLAGPVGQIGGVVLSDNSRRLATHTRLRVVNGASRFATLDVYIVDPGSNIATLSPTISSLGYRFGSGYQTMEPGTYDLVLVKPATKTVVYGPSKLGLPPLGLYTLVATDASEATAADTVLFVEP